MRRGGASAAPRTTIGAEGEDGRWKGRWPPFASNFTLVSVGVEGGRDASQVKEVNGVETGVRKCWEEGRRGGREEGRRGGGEEEDEAEMRRPSLHRSGAASAFPRHLNRHFPPCACSPHFAAAAHPSMASHSCDVVSPSMGRCRGGQLMVRSGSTACYSLRSSLPPCSSSLVLRWRQTPPRCCITGPWHVGEWRAPVLAALAASAVSSSSAYR